jgi:hypothetical protein
VEAEERLCAWCNDPNPRKASPYCTPYCQRKAKKDEEYFNGRYRDTIGYASRTCQICSKLAPSGQSHHVYGQRNDPDAEALVWLCAGCHQLVTILGNRAGWTGLTWENLVRYSWMRKRGKDKPPAPEVSVDIREVENEQ